MAKPLILRLKFLTNIGLISDLYLLVQLQNLFCWVVDSSLYCSCFLARKLLYIAHNLTNTLDHFGYYYLFIVDCVSKKLISIHVRRVILFGWKTCFLFLDHCSYCLVILLLFMSINLFIFKNIKMEIKYFIKNKHLPNWDRFYGCNTLFFYIFVYEFKIFYFQR